MPNLERGDVYDSWETTTGHPDPAFGGTVSSPYISLLSCPTSPPDEASLPVLAYAGNAGSSDYTNPPSAALMKWKGDGVMMDTVGDTGSGTYSAVRNNLDAISTGDGTSNTVLFSERCGSAVLQTRWDTALAPVLVTQVGNTTTSAPVIGVFSTPATGNQINSLLPQVNGALGFPSSNHPGGVVATFCDGHTIFIRDTVSPVVYAQLMTSNSKWTGAGYATNSPNTRTNWLPAQYNLSEADFR